MPYAIMRIAKIKSESAFIAIERHARDRDRLKNRQNPDKTAENRFFNHSGYLPDQSIVERFKQRTAGIKCRKDSVLGLEVVMAYSPDAVGTFDQSEWIRANGQWLTDTFGGHKNVIHFRLDMDERTPHLHAVIVPVVNGRLSARTFVNGKIALSRLQDSYAAEMERFGFERGRRYIDAPELASAHHVPVKVWQAAQAAIEYSEVMER